VAIQLGSAYGKVNIDASGVKKGVDEAKGHFGTLDQSAKQLGATLQNVGKAMTASITLPILAMAATSVMAASNMTESANKVAVVFGDSASSVLKWSDTTTEAFKISKQEALEAAGTFGNLFITMGITGDESAKFSMNLVGLAGDLSSFNNISTAEALIKLRAGLVGEMEPLRTLGIRLDAASVEQKAFEMGLADANGELSQAALLQARYALIMEQTTSAQGDAARTGNEFAGQLRELKANFNDLLATFGQYLLPFAKQVIQLLNDMMVKFKSLPEPIKKAIIIILGLVAVIGPLLIALGAIVPVLGFVTKSINPFSGGIFGLIGTFVKLLATATIVVNVLEFLGIATGPVGAAILGLNAAIAGVGASILAVLGPIALMIGAVALLYWAFKTNFGGITTAAQQLWFIIKFYFTQGWTWLRTSASQGLSNLVNSFKNINWRQVGSDIIMGIVNGFKAGIAWLVTAAKNAATAALNAIRKALDMHSPSGKFMELGKLSGQGYVMGLQKSMDPNAIARAMTRSVVNNNQRGGDSTTINLASGLTMKSARNMISANRRELLSELAGALS
jgi:hypothetical protein